MSAIRIIARLVLYSTTWLAFRLAADADRMAGGDHTWNYGYNCGFTIACLLLIGLSHEGVFK